MDSTQIFIAFGRKIEALEAQGANFDNVHEYDSELRVLLSMYLMIAKYLEAQGDIRPATADMLADPAFLTLLKTTVAKYLPQ